MNSSVACEFPEPDPSFRVGYVLLWFPLASETFIFREIELLRQLGLNINVYTMYGSFLRGCSRAMRGYSGSVFRMGIRAFFPILRAFCRQLRKRPRFVWQLMRQGLLRRMRNLESQAENTWCFLAGFLLAEKCLQDQIRLIHSAWANGPATAAWVASRLTGIPFAFTGRAGDIYPPDGLLAEKTNDAVFVRTNNAANIAWLKQFCRPEQEDKLKLVYNGLTFAETTPVRANGARPPYRILAVGRFARTKGFTYLLTAIARLRREKIDCELTLVGDGSWRNRLRRMISRLGLEQIVHLPGFVPNDELVELMRCHDVLVVPSVVHANGDRDGIPNVIMEACTLELPVVATDVCGIPEVIKSGQTGYLAPQRDAAALACAIRLCLEDYSHAASMAKNAAGRVRKMFDSRKNALTLMKLYRCAPQ